MRSYLDKRTRTEFLVRHLAEQNTNELAFHRVPYDLVINPQILTTFLSVVEPTYHTKHVKQKIDRLATTN